MSSGIADAGGFLAQQSQFKTPTRERPIRNFSHPLPSKTNSADLAAAPEHG